MSGGNFIHSAAGPDQGLKPTLPRIVFYMQQWGEAAPIEQEKALPF